MTRYLNFLLGSLSLAHGREANGNFHYLCATIVTLFRLSCLFVVLSAVQERCL